MRKLLRFMCLFWLAVLTGQVWAASADPVRIGVLAFRPKPQTLAQWQPLASVLKQAIPERDFVVQAYSFPEMEQAVAQRQVDFILTNPGHFVLINRRLGLSAPLATLMYNEQGLSVSAFGGVIFSRADTVLSSASQLRDKVVAFTSTESLGGYQMQAYALHQAGLDVLNDTRWLTTGAPHDKVVQAVLSGKADVGFVRSGLLESMAREGLIDLRQLRVMPLFSNQIPLPWQVSTRLYPEWPFVALPDLDSTLTRQVAVALLRLEANHPLTQAMGIQGFTIPSDYTPVAEMLAALRMPPFDQVPEFTWQDVWMRYIWQGIAGLVCVGLIIVLAFRLWLSNRSLAAERQRVLDKTRQLQDSEFRWQFAIEGAGDGVWDWDMLSQAVQFSPRWKAMLGYADSELAAQFSTWLALLHPEDHARADAALNAYLRGETEHYQIECRLRCRDGQYKWVLSRGMVVSRSVDGQPLRMIGTHSDISLRRQAERLEQFRSHVLDWLTQGKPLPDILRTIVDHVEQLNPAMLCSILLLDANSQRLGHGVAPSLPDFYNAAVEGLAIGPGVGSCGTAAFTGQRVVVDDIQTHPYWGAFRAVAAQAQLGACWSQPILATSGQVLGTFAIYHRSPHIPQDADITLIEQSARLVSLAIERKQAEIQLAESEARYRSLIELAHDGIVVVQHGDVQYSNPMMQLLSGYSPAYLGVRPFLSLVHEADQALVCQHMQACADDLHDAAQHCQFRLLSRLDGVKWVEMRCTAIDWQGQPATLNSLSDITERRRTEQQLQLAASVFTHAREGIMITDADGAIIDVNDTFTRITGFTRQEALGENPRILNSGRHDAEFYAGLWRSLIEKGHWYGEIWNRRKNGDIFAEMQTISAVYDADGQTQHYVALFSDITLIKEHEQQLEHIAHYDALTSLPNRVLLADRLHQAMSQAQRRQQALAVVYLDLDGFKAINDCHGHDVGDQLLMLLARRMRDTLREGDTLARLGGDEFVAVLLDLSNAADSASLLGRLLAATAQPVPVNGHLLQVSASLGVTFYPQREDVDADQLMRQADQAMYQAKLAGKNRYHIFDAEQDIYIKGQHESLDRIRRALSEGEFVLYYQPKVNMRLGTVIGAEALIRWQHPDKGLLSPASFLPMIEGHPLAVSVGEWVLDTALGQMARWQAMGLTLPVSVNIGARQLQQMDFVIRLRQILARHPQVSPSQLELEILETSALEDLAEVSQVIAACRDMGVNFALDDFGTGYSSLTYLKHLQVALLKIDQSFVRDMLDDPDDLAILSGVIGLAAAFRRDVMAEGVETIEHGAMLLQLGCERAQGYGIAHPMPADAFPNWAARWQADPLWRRLPPLNRDDLPLLFAITELRAWMTALEHYLHKARDLPPVLDAQHSRFGHWLASEGERRHGQHPLFMTIRQQHQQLYALGQQLCQHCLAGNASAALTQLDAMHQQKHALLDALKTLAAELGG